MSGNNFLLVKVFSTEEKNIDTTPANKTDKQTDMSTYKRFTAQVPTWIQNTTCFEENWEANAS